MTGRPESGDVHVHRGAQVPDDPKLSVCILVLEQPDLAQRCLDSLRRPGGSPQGTEFVVVANGTPTDRLERLTSGDDVVLVVNHENLGFPQGCNQAASVAKAPILLFLNDDSTVDTYCVEALVGAVSADSSIGAVGARIVSLDGVLEEAGSVIWRDGSAAHVGKGLPSGSQAYLQQRDVDYSSANGLLIRRDVWDVVGGFDERYFPAYFEDVDLCLALAAHGYRVRYEPGARVFHRGSQSTSLIYREFLLSRNQRKLVEKWGRELDRFEPRPVKDSGPDFDAAMERAIRLAATGGSPASHARRPGPIPDGPHAPEHTDPELAAMELHAEYQAYLEQRVAIADQRIGSLEKYLSRLWNVRLRRWAWSRLQRRLD
jgi:GT2 family glycosyltransferase